MGIARLRGKPGRGLFLKAFVALVWFVLAVVFAGAGFAFSVVNEFSKGLPDVEKLASYEPSETTNIYSSEGYLIGTLFKENRVWVPFSRIPDNLKHAVIAIEDRRFYEHSGVDPKGVMRAVADELQGNGERQGASTITMQLTRAIFLTPEHSMERKIREMLLALKIEKRFTKDEILEMYLNQIYLGSGAYGVQAAAKTYFNKSVQDLNLDECAVIAGLPQRPTEYSPLVDIKAAKDRQMRVLNAMAECGYITQAQAEDAKHRPIALHAPKHQEAVLKYPYFTSYVIHELSQRYPEELLYRGGLRIYTTLNTKMQREAEAAVKNGVLSAQHDGYNVHQSALVCLQNGTGYIRAMVGGTGWSKQDQFNRAWQATRQPGSSFKLFVYATAFENGYTPESVINDTPVSFRVSSTETYAPHNSDQRWWGACSIERCIQYSRDIPSIKMGNAVGLDRVIDIANRMGLKEHIDPNLSICLGAVDVTVLEMAQAYSIVPNLGVKVDATPIMLIKDMQGNILEDNRTPFKEPVVSEATCTSLITCMEKVVQAGTATTANIDRPAAGKTGTTDDFRDTWFCGYTPELTTVVWCGNDDNASTGHGFGGTVAAPIWHDFMKPALAKVPIHQFGVTEKGEVGILMCSETHRRASATCPETYREFFKPNQIPETWCRIHTIDRVGAARFASLNRGNLGGVHIDEVDASAEPARKTAPKKAARVKPASQDETAPVPADGDGPQATPMEDVPQEVQPTPTEAPPAPPPETVAPPAPPPPEAPAPPPPPASPAPAPTGAPPSDP
ncbi:MAG: transglycosylase domain-containing protein [Candidatus Xenobia bacterium]